MHVGQSHTPDEPLQFLSPASMVGLITNLKVKTFLSKVSISLNSYLKLVARFRSMATFTMLGPMSLMTVDIVLQGFFFLIKNCFHHNFKVFGLLRPKMSSLNLFRVKTNMLIF